MLRVLVVKYKILEKMSSICAIYCVYSLEEKMLCQCDFVELLGNTF